MIRSKTFLFKQTSKSISANSYQLLMLATNFKIKFGVNK